MTSLLAHIYNSSILCGSRLNEFAVCFERACLLILSVNYYISCTIFDHQVLRWIMFFRSSYWEEQKKINDANLRVFREYYFILRNHIIFQFLAREYFWHHAQTWNLRCNLSQTITLYSATCLDSTTFFKVWLVSLEQRSLNCTLYKTFVEFWQMFSTFDEMLSNELLRLSPCCSTLMANDYDNGENSEPYVEDDALWT